MFKENFEQDDMIMNFTYMSIGINYVLVVKRIIEWIRILLILMQLKSQYKFSSIQKDAFHICMTYFFELRFDYSSNNFYKYLWL